MTTNRQRGDIEITLNEQTYTLRPDFEAIARIEERLKCGIYGLAGRWISKLDIGLREASVVIEECIKSGGGAPPQRIGEVIRAAGLSNYIKQLIKLITHAISGDEKREAGEGEA